MAKKFIKKIVSSPSFRKGALRKKLGVKGEQKITKSQIGSRISKLKGKAKKGKLSSSELRTMRELVFAKNLMGFKKVGRKKKNA